MNTFINDSVAMLKERGIRFTTFNGGAHLIVMGSAGFIDFWPTTGKWHDRAGQKGFGVESLIAHILPPAAAAPASAESRIEALENEVTTLTEQVHELQEKVDALWTRLLNG